MIKVGVPPFLAQAKRGQSYINESELDMAKEIVNNLQVSTEGNGWQFYEAEQLNFQRFRMTFQRYLIKFNKASGENRRYQFECIHELFTFKCWRIQ